MTPRRMFATLAACDLEIHNLNCGLTHCVSGQANAAASTESKTLLPMRRRMGHV
jgi:hypothetical protein